MVIRPLNWSELIQRGLGKLGNRQPVNGRACRPAVQFYSIELMPLFDGRLSVGVLATVCEDEGG